MYRDYLKQLNQAYLWVRTYFLLMLAYSFLRFSFLVWNRSSFDSAHFSELVLAFLHGFRFDAVGISILSIPLWFVAWLGLFISDKVWRRIWLFLVFLETIPFFVLNIIDIEYFNFNGRRMTCSSLQLFQEAKGKGFGFLIINWGGILSGLFFLISWGVLFYKCVSKKKYVDDRNETWKTKVGTQLISLFFLIVLGRGGFQSKPIDFVDSALFNTPILNNLALNSTFTILKSLDKATIPDIQFFTKEADYIPLLNGSYIGPNELGAHRLPKKTNVVIILLESFSWDYLGKPHHVKGYTPFLDELSEKGILFTNAFANGRRSIEGVSSILAGIPALMNEAFITSEFASNYFVGAGTIFSRLGYKTSFFHGGNNGTMYFDRFSASAGLSDYFGAKEYVGLAEDNDQIWGIYDEPFFKFFAEKLNSFSRPFFSMIFSLSSHHPYKIPESMKGRFEKGPLEILESIQYADWSLRQFFKMAEKMEWYKDTLFVITADHTQKTLLKEFDSEVGRFRIPILFFHPTFHWPQVNTLKPVQHIDILPSILDLLSEKNQPLVLLGQSVFNKDPEKSVILFNDQRHFLINKDWILVRDLKGELTFYKVNDPFLLSKANPIDQEKIKVENKLKASIQYFNQGLWDNRLYFPNK